MQIEFWTNLPDVDGPRVRRLRRMDYDRLVDAGAFADERVELIRGVIVRMSPQGPSHSGPIERLTSLLVTALRLRASVRVQLPLVAPDDSEPEPDIAVVDALDHDDAHPSTAHLVVEVARTSQEYDRGTKGPLYAQMRVPEYWLVDVALHTVEVYREPSGDRYARVETLRTGDRITLVAFPDVAIDVSSILR